MPEVITQSISEEPEVDVSLNAEQFKESVDAEMAERTSLTTAESVRSSQQGDSAELRKSEDVRPENVEEMLHKAADQVQYSRIFLVRFKSWTKYFELPPVHIGWGCNTLKSISHANKILSYFARNDLFFSTIGKYVLECL